MLTLPQNKVIKTFCHFAVAELLQRFFEHHVSPLMSLAYYFI